MEKELHVIETTKPWWVIKTDVKLIDLEDHSRWNNLRFEETTEHKNEPWEDCENKIYDLLENKLEMDIENVVIERAHWTRKKIKNRLQPIVAQFSFYKDKMNILKNSKKLKSTRFSIFEDFSRETAAICKEKGQEVLANREKRYDIMSKLPYCHLQTKSAIVSSFLFLLFLVRYIVILSLII